MHYNALQLIIENSSKNEKQQLYSNKHILFKNKNHFLRTSETHKCKTFLIPD